MASALASGGCGGDDGQKDDPQPPTTSKVAPSTTAARTSALDDAASCREYFGIIGDLSMDDDQSAVAFLALANETKSPLLRDEFRRIGEGFQRHDDAIPTASGC